MYVKKLLCANYWQSEIDLERHDFPLEPFVKNYISQVVPSLNIYYVNSKSLIGQGAGMNYLAQEKINYLSENGCLIIPITVQTVDAITQKFGDSSGAFYYIVMDSRVEDLTSGDIQSMCKILATSFDFSDSAINCWIENQGHLQIVGFYHDFMSMFLIAPHYEKEKMLSFIFKNTGLEL